MPSVAKTENLKRWPKGQSGNPSGRPKARATAILRETITDDDLRAIWKQTIQDAKGGDKDARRDVFDRLEGKAVARTEAGEPGDFDIDLSNWSAEDLERAAAKLRRVK
jgi:hypothetical protein